MRNFLASAGVLAIASCLLFEGGLILRFAALEEQLDSLTQDSAAPSAETYRTYLPRLRQAMDWPGVSSQAALLWNRLAPDDDDPLSAQIGPSSILSLRPTNGLAWLQLARLRRLNGESMAAIVGALDMSRYTTPHEIDAMEERIRFQFENWTEISEDERKRAIDAIFELQAKWVIDDKMAADFKTLLDRLPPVSRMQIAAALKARGAALAPVMKWFGL